MSITEAKQSISLYKKYIFHKRHIIENSPNGLRSMWREVITMMQVSVYFYEEKKRVLPFLIKNINSFLLENETMPLDKPCNSISMPDIISSTSKALSVSLYSLSEEDISGGKKATRRRRETRKSSNSNSEEKTMKKSVSTFSLSSKSSITLPSLFDGEKNDHEIFLTWKTFFSEQALKEMEYEENKWDNNEEEEDDNTKEKKKSKWKKRLPFFPIFFEKKKKSPLSGQDYSEKVNVEDILSSWRYKMRRNAICLYHNCPNDSPNNSPGNSVSQRSS